MNDHSFDTLLKSAAHELTPPPALPDDFTPRLLRRHASAKQSQLAEQRIWEQWILLGSFTTGAAAAGLLAFWLRAASAFHHARQADVRTGDVIDLLLHLP